MKRKLKLSQNLTDAQRDAIHHAHLSHGSLDRAQIHLQHALGAAQGGREKSWAKKVFKELERVQACVLEHQSEVLGPRGLYKEIEEDAVHLSSRLSELREDLKKLEVRVRSLRQIVENSAKGDFRDISEIRFDGEVLFKELRRIMAKESDLVFERFNEPPALD